MATPSTVARPFNALSGTEIKKIILNEIERNMEADYRFKNHLTYPMVSWRWVLAAKVYPSEQPDIKVEIEKDPQVSRTPCRLYRVRRYRYRSQQRTHPSLLPPPARRPTPRAAMPVSKCPLLALSAGHEQYAARRRCLRTSRSRSRMNR